MININAQIHKIILTMYIALSKGLSNVRYASMTRADCSAAYFLSFYHKKNIFKTEHDKPLVQNIIISNFKPQILCELYQDAASSASPCTFPQDYHPQCQTFSPCNNLRGLVTHSFHFKKIKKK